MSGGPQRAGEPEKNGHTAMSNVLIMGFIAWWGYKTFGIMGVVGFPVMSAPLSPHAQCQARVAEPCCAAAAAGAGCFLSHTHRPRADDRS